MSGDTIQSFAATAESESEVVRDLLEDDTHNIIDNEVDRERSDDSEIDEDSPENSNCSLVFPFVSYENETPKKRHRKSKITVVQQTRYVEKDGVWIWPYVEIDCL